MIFHNVQCTNYNNTSGSPSLPAATAEDWTEIELREFEEDSGFVPPHGEPTYPSLEVVLLLAYCALDAHDLSSPSLTPVAQAAPAAPASPPAHDDHRPPALDDIKVEYHKASGRSPEIYAFEDFTRDEPEADPQLLGLSEEPWKPFSSRLDFEFAELTHEAHMNKGQVSKLLEIIRSITGDKDKFTFKTVDDVDVAWSKAQSLYPSVRHNHSLFCVPAL